MEQNKEKKQNRFLKWCDDHVVELVIGGMGIAGAVAGFIVGKNIAEDLELGKTADWVKENVPGIVESAGLIGAVSAMDAISTNVPEAKKIIDDYAKNHQLNLGKAFYEEPCIQAIQALLVDKL